MTNLAHAAEPGAGARSLSRLVDHHAAAFRAQRRMEARAAQETSRTRPSSAPAGIRAGQHNSHRCEKCACTRSKSDMKVVATTAARLRSRRGAGCCVGSSTIGSVTAKEAMLDIEAFTGVKDGRHSADCDWRAHFPVFTKRFSRRIPRERRRWILRRLPVSFSICIPRCGRR
jgi:hypothetical protein